MDTARIAALLQPFAMLDPAELEKTSAYLHLLLKWNSRMNLTAVRNRDEIVTRHFGESFFAAKQLLSPAADLRVIDVGSGAGFPGLPLAIVAPTAQVTLIESSARKSAFLHEVVHALELTNIEVFNGRAEKYGGSGDLVIMRAVERFEDVLPVAFSLVRAGGRLALMIGVSQYHAVMELVPGAQWRDPLTIPSSDSRIIMTGIKAVKVG